MTAPDAAQVAAARVDRLLGQLRSGADPRAAVVAEELTRCLVQLYGGAVRRLRGLTNKTVNKEPKWRVKGPTLTSGHDKTWS